MWHNEMSLLAIRSFVLAIGNSIMATKRKARGDMMLKRMVQEDSWGQRGGWSKRQQHSSASWPHLHGDHAEYKATTKPFSGHAWIQGQEDVAAWCCLGIALHFESVAQCRPDSGLTVETPVSHALVNTWYGHTSKSNWGLAKLQCKPMF